MAVTARFVVSRLTPLGGHTEPNGEVVPPWGVEVEMTPDYANGANEQWKAASPSGVFRVTVDPSKTDALDQLALNTHLEIVLNPLDP